MNFHIIGREFEWIFNDETEKWEKGEKASECVERLAKFSGPLFVDTETTGLRWMLGHKVFSIAIAFQDGPAYYFNWQKYDHVQLDMFDQFEPDWELTDYKAIAPIFEAAAEVIVGHNLKFDWHMLNQFGYKLGGKLSDTMVRERILSNDEFSYSLDNVVKRNLPEYKKDDAVEKYIELKGLFDILDVPGKKGKIKNKYYYLVPFRIIAPYATNDILITRELYKNQTERLAKIPRSPAAVLELEEEVLKLCCHIEERGVLVDQEYCKEGIKYEDERAKATPIWFQNTFSQKFVDSSAELSPIFISLGFTPPKTAKNNDSVDSAFLATVKHELATRIEDHRDAVKRANTYFRSFIGLSDRDNVLHPDMKQTGTRTGRFSYSDPNLQNIPKEDESPFPIRRAIIPRPGHFFVMIDYNQQEFRMMLDYAGELELIKRIIDGHDPHQATADLCGISRKAAKTINFGLMYGMGIQKLADRLGITYGEAQQLKWKYFGALPNVKNLIYQVTDVAKQRGAVFTWMNRKCDFKNPDFAYKAINAIIQGGCADVTKLAMLKIDELLREGGYDTRIALQIHDELVLEVPFDEVDIVGAIQAAMESVYPHKHIPLTTSVSYSLKSLHDVIEVESTKEIEVAVGVELQKQSAQVPKGTSEHLVHEDAATYH